MHLFPLVRAAAALLATLAPSVSARLFTVNCAPLTIQRGDPIVSPGAISSHVHAVVGGTAFALSMSEQAATAAKATTCDKLLDKSNYWQPQLYHQTRDARFELVPMQGAAIYYLDRACDYARGRRSCHLAAPARAPPAGLRMVVGNPFLRSYNASNLHQLAISHVCLGSDNSGETAHLPTKKCGRLRAQTFFPSCWDGTRLDSADHSSHMAFPAVGGYNSGVCPPSHPLAIMSLFYEFFYDTGAIRDFYRLVWATGDLTGYSLHADYINGWTDQEALELSLDTCTGHRGVEDANCSLNVGPDGPGRARPRQVETEPPREQIGLEGPLYKLPGNIEVSGHPIDRI